MFTIREYVVAENLEQAYESLNKGKNNAVLGGLLWLKMGNRNINRGIDLSNLGLDKIEEDEEYFKIGCMTTLRDIEINEDLNNAFNGILRKSVRGIVGVQFRNCATIGGSIYSRFGFSDPLTALLALDTYVEMYKGGIIPIEEFVTMPLEKDILVRIIIKKNSGNNAYLTHRISATDIPVLTVSAGIVKNKWRIAVGARPNQGMLSYKAAEILNDSINEEAIVKASEAVINELTFGTNGRGSKEYRELLAKTLVRRGIEEVIGGK